jgi:hypothetical protein
MQNIIVQGKSPVFLDSEISPKLAKIIKTTKNESKKDKKVFNNSLEAIAFLETL